VLADVLKRLHALLPTKCTYVGAGTRAVARGRLSFAGTGAGADPENDPGHHP